MDRSARLPPFILLIVLVALLAMLIHPTAAAVQQRVCEGPFVSVGPPLNDLGSAEYVRMGEEPTGYHGGLYPGGSNQRPPAHEAAGVAIARQVVPLDMAGEAAADGRIVLISIGMSNAAMEFGQLMQLYRHDPEVHPQLRLINGAQPGKISTDWTNVDAPTWDYVDEQLYEFGLTPEQVQIAWVKNVRTGGGDFPEKALALQGDLEEIARNLKIRYPNIKIAYFSSRTRSYTYWEGLSPEPVAYESGFAVKWLIEKQIEGDAALNYDLNQGPVIAPFLSWGPYLWIDGLNPRSDGRVWTQADLVPDCTHPSESGEAKVAEQLMDFFKTDSTTQPWFLAAPPPPPEPTDNNLYLPAIANPTTTPATLRPDPDLHCHETD